MSGFAAAQEVFVVDDRIPDDGEIVIFEGAGGPVTGYATEVFMMEAPDGILEYYRRRSVVPSSSSPTEGIGRIIRAAALEEGLDPELVAAVVRVESGFNPAAVSSAGACGLMQLMPETAAALGVSDVFDPEANVRGGVRYLASQLRRFGTPELALAAYNAGPEAVARYGGVPPYPETREYVRLVMSIYMSSI